ncbi:hypothetical protein ACFW6F_32890 [Streptomyces sp. NPDC058746]|uniref:hypothetical protein n=1 Tax=Streptomyces sp. NPDC058746 TaxID=3346622 RepID=UPI0036C527AE
MALQSSYDDGFGCGCSIEITAPDGSTWEYHRGDSVWRLVRLDQVDPDTGVMASSGWVELKNHEVTAHPKHLVSDIFEALNIEVDDV